MEGGGMEGGGGGWRDGGMEGWRDGGMEGGGRREEGGGRREEEGGEEGGGMKDTSMKWHYLEDIRGAHSTCIRRLYKRDKKKRKGRVR